MKHIAILDTYAHKVLWRCIVSIKIVCTVCKGSGKLSVTREPGAESHGEEMVGECPTCHGKGEIDI